MSNIKSVLTKNIQPSVNIIDKYCTSKSICVAVSGGIDSMCLAHLFVSFRDKFKNLAIVSIDHSIRDESAKDVEFVKAWAKSVGLDIFIYKADIIQLAKKNVKSIELMARDYRRMQYQSILEKGFDYIALAHHGDDQVETILYRIMRGTGLKGLKGMNVLTRDSLIRPLLCVNKSDIMEYATCNNIPYRYDSTNSDINYDRNYLRHEIIPKLKSRWNLNKAISRLSNNAMGAQEYIDSKIDFNIIEVDNNIAFLPVTSFVNDIECFTFLEYVAQVLKFDITITKTMINNISNIAKCGSGKYVVLEGTVVAKVVFDKIAIFDNSNDNRYSYVALNGCGSYRIGSYNIVVNRVKKDFALKSISKTSSDKSSNNISKHLRELFVNLDMLSDCVIRFRQQGDSFFPFRGQLMSLKKHFINKKIPNTHRDNIPLIAKDDRVLCICGVEISDCLKIDKDCANIGKISLSKVND